MTEFAKWLGTMVGNVVVTLKSLDKPCCKTETVSECAPKKVAHKLAYVAEPVKPAESWEAPIVEPSMVEETRTTLGDLVQEASVGQDETNPESTVGEEGDDLDSGTDEGGRSKHKKRKGKRY